MKNLIHIAVGVLVVLVWFAVRTTYPTEIAIRSTKERLNDSNLVGTIKPATHPTGIVIQTTKERLNDSRLAVTIKATIPGDTKLYALQNAENDILFSTIEFDTTFLQRLDGDIKEKGSRHSEKDTSVNATVTYYSDYVLWQQNIKVGLTDSFSLKGKVSYLYKKGDEYLPGEKEFKVHIQPERKVSNNQPANINKSLIWIFLTAFGGGLLALLTPCVYSMIPVTVSFFTKRSKSKSEGIKNALYYSSSIIFIFTLLGFFITLVFGPAALNNLATNWIANLVFFGVFVLFGVSFLGAFEITLPSSWANKTDSKAGVSSFAGIFFMALTLVVVSFSCTGPIIGNLLVLAAKGSYWGPLTGMLGFSTALALPFALFAFFPSKLNMLGKAGGWLNAVKVTLGFLELALALKFLSNADLAQGWRLLDREIFIAAWIVLFSLLGLYLLGKIKFRHDDELPKNDFGFPFLTVTRLSFAIAAFVFAVYMIPGLWGAPLKGISAFVPPMGTQDFNASSNKLSASIPMESSGDDLHPKKYYDQMKIYEPEVVTTYGMVTYFDYDEAIEIAKKLKKPLMLDFTGINCVNCRKMEGQVWSDPKVMKILQEDFVIVSLYVDVQNVELPPGEQFYSKALNKQVETLGDKNADMQVIRYGANTQPYYFFIDATENKLAEEGYGYDPSVEKFIALLNKVKAEYKKKKFPMKYADYSYVKNDIDIGLSGQKDMDHTRIQKKLANLWSLVGNTPMVEIHYTYQGRHRKIYVKCEHYNLTGSIKDRMALYILQRAYELGTIKPGDTIVEATSGNTGIAFSAIGKALGHKVKIIMPDWLSVERINIIKSLGAEVVLISKEQGGFLGSIDLSEKIASEQPNIFLPKQFENCFNGEAHEKTTGKEIWMQLQSLEQTPDAFVAGIGTGGTVMGVGQYLKKRNPAVCIHPLEPKESPTLSTGSKVGSHRIQGISDEFIPAIVNLERLDEVLQASDGDSILMAQKIAKQLGLAVGISSGANLIGAILLQEQFGGNAVVVTVFPDSNKKYLSTDLVKHEPFQEEYMCHDVEFIDYLPVKR